jgi:hypothetical protein
MAALFSDRVSASSPSAPAPTADVDQPPEAAMERAGEII